MNPFAGVVLTASAASATPTFNFAATSTTGSEKFSFGEASKTAESPKPAQATVSAPALSSEQTKQSAPEQISAFKGGGAEENVTDNLVAVVDSSDNFLTWTKQVAASFNFV